MVKSVVITTDGFLISGRKCSPFYSLEPPCGGLCRESIFIGLLATLTHAVAASVLFSYFAMKSMLQSAS
jgi:hypothetical protein